MSIVMRGRMLKTVENKDFEIFLSKSLTNNGRFNKLIIGSMAGVSLF